VTKITPFLRMAVHEFLTQATMLKTLQYWPTPVRQLRQLAGAAKR
jgi:hypothetical protein